MKALELEIASVWFTFAWCVGCSDAVPFASGGGGSGGLAGAAGANASAGSGGALAGGSSGGAGAAGSPASAGQAGTSSAGEGGAGGAFGVGGGGSGGAGSGGAGAGGAAGGAHLMITVDGVTMGDRLCFKPEASNSGGNHSPRIDWSGVPAGTRSLALTMYDQSNQTPHRIVCNLPPDMMSQPADVGTTVPAGAQVSTGHNRPGDAWYGPGAGGAPHSYEIRIWALATATLEGGCDVSGAGPTRAVYDKLKAAPPTLVLESAYQVLWGNVDGECFP